MEEQRRGVGVCVCACDTFKGQKSNSPEHEDHVLQGHNSSKFVLRYHATHCDIYKKNVSIILRVEMPHPLSNVERVTCAPVISSVAARRELCFLA